jgi:hypothetical protein
LQHLSYCMTHGLLGDDARIPQRLHGFYVCEDRAFGLYRSSSVKGRLLASWKCNLSDPCHQDMAVVRACPTPRTLPRIPLHGRPRCNLDIAIGIISACQTNPLERRNLGFINRADGRLRIYMTAVAPSSLSLDLPTKPLPSLPLLLRSLTCSQDQPYVIALSSFSIKVQKRYRFFTHCTANYGPSSPNACQPWRVC